MSNQRGPALVVSSRSPAGSRPSMTALAEDLVDRQARAAVIARARSRRAGEQGQGGVVGVLDLASVVDQDYRIPKALEDRQVLVLLVGDLLVLQPKLLELLVGGPPRPFVAEADFHAVEEAVDDGAILPVDPPRATQGR